MKQITSSQQLLQNLRNQYITIAKQSNLTIPQLNKAAQAQAWLDGSALETPFQWVCAAQLSMFHTTEERNALIKAAASF